MNTCVLISVLDCNYELFRDQVELGEIIGEGQFGDVHKGMCHMRSTKNTPGNAVAVAIKTCKTDADMATTDTFLEEACKKINICKYILVSINKMITYVQTLCNNSIIRTLYV